MTKILGLIRYCSECPNRRYVNVWYECDLTGARLPKDITIPKWCPLPNHPAQEIERLETEVANLKLKLGPAPQSKPFIPGCSVCGEPGCPDHGM